MRGFLLPLLLPLFVLATPASQLASSLAATIQLAPTRPLTQRHANCYRPDPRVSPGTLPQEQDEGQNKPETRRSRRHEAPRAGNSSSTNLMAGPVPTAGVAPSCLARLAPVARFGCRRLLVVFSRLGGAPTAAAQAALPGGPKPPDSLLASTRRPATSRRFERRRAGGKLAGRAASPGRGPTRELYREEKPEPTKAPEPANQ